MASHACVWITSNSVWLQMVTFLVRKRTSTKHKLPQGSQVLEQGLYCGPTCLIRELEFAADVPQWGDAAVIQAALRLEVLQLQKLDFFLGKEGLNTTSKFCLQY